MSHHPATLPTSAAHMQPPQPGPTSYGCSLQRGKCKHEATLSAACQQASAALSSACEPHLQGAIVPAVLVRVGVLAASTAVVAGGHIPGRVHCEALRGGWGWVGGIAQVGGIDSCAQTSIADMTADWAGGAAEEAWNCSLEPGAAMRGATQLILTRQQQQRTEVDIKA